MAPTAPHGTPPPEDKTGKKSKRTGPERFWWPRYVLPVFAFGFVLSMIAHVAFFGRSLFMGEDFEFNDQDGEATIPIELLAGDPEPEPPPSEPPPAPIPPVTPNGTDNALDAGLFRDASADAAAKDASAIVDASEAPHDAAPLRDASRDFSMSDAAVIAAADAGNAPKNAVDMIGAAGAVEAGPPLVVVFINMDEIRKNPVGAQIGPLLSAIPQWDDFMRGTGVDPVRDTDWVLISGPSLKDSSRDIILVRYGMSDRIADHALDMIQQNATPGTPVGPFDAGVPGVKAMLGHADRAPRVFMRPKSHFIAVVPVDVAHAVAQQLVKAKVDPHLRAGEAMRLILQHPAGPFPKFFPEKMSELDLWIVPRADGGVDVHADGQCPDEQTAIAAMTQATAVITNGISTGNMMADGVVSGYLRRIVATRAGTHAKLDLTITAEDLENLLAMANLAMSFGGGRR